MLSADHPPSLAGPRGGVEGETGLTRCPESRTLKSRSGCLSGDRRGEGALSTCWALSGRHDDDARRACKRRSPPDRLRGSPGERQSVTSAGGDPSCLDLPTGNRQLWALAAVMRSQCPRPGGLACPGWAAQGGKRRESAAGVEVCLSK